MHNTHPFAFHLSLMCLDHHVERARIAAAREAAVDRVVSQYVAASADVEAL